MDPNLHGLTAILDDRRRVKFSLKRRKGQPNYFVTFRGPDRGRVEKSTKETSRKRAVEAAEKIVEEAYVPPPPAANRVRWDDALTLLRAAATAQNLRPRTVDDYLQAVTNLRKVYPDLSGPADVTAALAREYKGRRILQGLSAYTVRGDLRKLAAVWSWFLNDCGVVEANPWSSVERPKADKLTPRYIEPAEEAAFFKWLSDRWGGWRLPVLFYTVKGLIGCRISALCSARTDQLRDGRLYLTADVEKGRKTRAAKLPGDVYEELTSVAGPAWLWERFPTELNERLKAKKLKRGCLPEFHPDRLKWWLQDEMTRYNKAYASKPGFRSFTSHDFRATAMSTAVRAGASVDDAAVAFTCSPSTIRQHYLLRDEEQVADATLELVRRARQKT